MKSTSLIAAAASCNGRGCTGRQDALRITVEDGSHHVSRLQSSDC
jgi:hypothetical protein